MPKLLVALCIAGLAALTSPLASAHVEIVSSFPEQFATVDPIPTSVWIQFSDNLQNLDGEIVNTIEVMDSTGLLVSYEDAIVEAGRITTKLSGQSAAGVFTVKYRVVGQDGHVIEGEYTFNASPDYAEAVPATTSVPQESSNFPVGGVLIAFLLATFFGGIYIKSRDREDS
jgi:methionine-rich copper-binding protein CopC